MAITINTMPEQYLNALDEVLVASSYASKYGVQGAEFVSAKTVRVPVIDFTDASVNDYDKFVTENSATLDYKAYELDNDKQAVFSVDAVDDIDTASVLTTNIVSQYERTQFAPYVDSDFFSKAVAAAGSTGTDALSATNIKSAIRAARTALVNAGLSGGDLYMTSEALGYLEDATDRQWSNETSITDTVGSYDGFTIYEVPEDRLSADFIVISGGTTTIRYITKRAVAYTFQPGQHTHGDSWLTQLRWVFGTVAYENKRPGIYALVTA